MESLNWKVIAGMGILAVGFLCGAFWKQRTIDSMRLEQAEAVAQAEKQAKEKQAALMEAHGVEVQKFEKERKAYESKIADLRTAVRSGAVRLSVPAYSADGTGSSAVGSGEARSELDGATAEALIDITESGDKAILELNSCIDRYNSVREKLK